MLIAVFVLRSIGFFGELRVLFNVESADAATLALADGTPLFSYFESPVPDLSLAPSALLQQLSASLSECGRACLADRTCLAFSFPVLSSNVCELYLAIQTEPNRMVTAGAQYYQKLQDRVSAAITNVTAVAVYY